MGIPIPKLVGINKFVFWYKVLNADEKIAEIVNSIAKYTKVKKNLTILCLFLAGISVLFFVIYGFFNSNQAIQFVADHKFDNKKLEKVMTNPSIKFEYKENEFYDIKASSAIHKGGSEDDVLMFDVDAQGASGNIKAGELLISKQGNKLFFSKNPVLTIRQAKKDPSTKDQQKNDIN